MCFGTFLILLLCGIIFFYCLKRSIRESEENMDSRLNFMSSKQEEIERLIFSIGSSIQEIRQRLESEGQCSKNKAVLKENCSFSKPKQNRRGRKKKDWEVSPGAIKMREYRRRKIEASQASSSGDKPHRIEAKPQE